MDRRVGAAACAQGIHLLDAGCGTGAGGVDAAARGCRDAGEAFIEIARGDLPAARFDVCDLESLPYGDESFDATMAINSVFYCEDQPAAMRELCRVTKRGGLWVSQPGGPPAECEMRVFFRPLRRCAATAAGQHGTCFIRAWRTRELAVSSRPDAAHRVDRSARLSTTMSPVPGRHHRRPAPCKKRSASPAKKQSNTPVLRSGRRLHSTGWTCSFSQCLSLVRW